MVVCVGLKKENTDGEAEANNAGQAYKVFLYQNDHKTHKSCLCIGV